jgi:hypothetical protein
MIVALVLAATAVWMTWDTRTQLQGLEQVLVRRQQGSADQSAEALVLARQAQEISRDSAAKAALLEARLAEVALQRGQLDDLIQSLIGLALRRLNVSTGREFLHEAAAGHRLRQRLMKADADAFTTIVTVQEITQGWTAEINRKNPGRPQIYAHRQFHDAVAQAATPHCACITTLPDRIGEVVLVVNGSRLCCGMAGSRKQP